MRNPNKKVKISAKLPDGLPVVCVIAHLTDDELMGSESGFDKSLNDAGLLRLMTYKRTARHIGIVW